MRADPMGQRLRDWGEAIDISHFYGRQTELKTLETWTLRHRCRLIGIFGLGGIGKTTLSVKLAQTIQDQFECVIWRSLRQAPPLKTLLKDIVPQLTDIEVDEVSMRHLMEQLHQQRCLIVLDNVEAILDVGNRSGQYQANYFSSRQYRVWQPMGFTRATVSAFIAVATAGDVLVRHQS
jgi:ATPase subunit of ABC transporter with duplicated ATPase domains